MKTLPTTMPAVLHSLPITIPAGYSVLHDAAASLAFSVPCAVRVQCCTACAEGPLPGPTSKQPANPARALQHRDPVTSSAAL